MCFQNLPITFDEAGVPTLADEGGFDLSAGPRPGATTAAAPGPGDRRPGDRARDKEFAIDPVTRVAGALGFHTTVDLERRAVTSAHAEAVLFRGYELILRGRDPLEAIHISSRACGVCGGVHATCSAMALEMCFGATPPPLAMIARNLAEAAELFYDHCLHLFLLAGPDYSAQMVSRTNPGLWSRAQRAAAPNAHVHGKVTIGEIMTGLNPLRGEFVTEALDVTRAGREIVSLVYGKYPHPSAVLPAGLGTRLDRSTLNQVLARVVRLLDYAKKVATLWDDLIEFFYDADPAYRRVGLRPANLISTGMWDAPDIYDADYRNADVWGAARLCPPGVVVDGQLRTTELRQINLGIEEFVAHSFYDDWTHHGTGDDAGATAAPDGAPLSPYHPWNKRTLPRPEETDWRGRYSWATAPRWDREPMESGPLARQWITVANGGVDTDFISTAPGRLDITVPESDLPETTVTWRVPDVVNAFERLRARSTHVAYCLMAGYTFLLRGFDALRSDTTDMARRFEVTDGLAAGFWEAGRGTLTHFGQVDGGRLANYQILTPSTWMASPRDPWGVPGPYEQAVLNTPLLEEVDDPSDFVGIDILRTVRSFDPCLPCAVHLHTGGGTIVRDATSCACGME